jgi:hypothetical protein
MATSCSRTWTSSIVDSPSKSCLCLRLVLLEYRHAEGHTDGDAGRSGQSGQCGQRHVTDALHGGLAADPPGRITSGTATTFCPMVLPGRAAMTTTSATRMMTDQVSSAEVISPTRTFSAGSEAACSAERTRTWSPERAESPR